MKILRHPINKYHSLTHFPNRNRNNSFYFLPDIQKFLSYYVSVLPAGKIVPLKKKKKKLENSFVWRLTSIWSQPEKKKDFDADPRV